jgi:hypothetical protein
MSALPRFVEHDEGRADIRNEAQSETAVSV